MFLRLLIIAFLILSINLSGCSQNTRIPDNFDPHGKIVYIEDLSGKSGLTDFNFGDLVILDPETKEKIVLTRDRYYNAHPSWSPDGDKIVFESKRVGAFTDASTQSNLFIYHLNTGEIVRLDEDFKSRFPDIIEREFNQSPAWSNDGSRIAFVNRVGARGRIVIYYIEKDTLEIISDDIFFRKPLRWSSDDEYLLYGQRYTKAEPKSLFHPSVVILNIEEGNIREIGDSDWAYSMGNESNGRVYFTGQLIDMIDSEYSAWYTYDIKNDTVSMVYESSNMLEADVYVYGSKGYIINISPSNENSFIRDIYRLDLSDFSAEQLTTDGHEKMDMDILRRKK